MNRRILNLILAAELVFTADLLLAANQQRLSVPLFYLLFAVLWFVCCRLIRLPLKKHVFLPFILPLFIALFIYVPWAVISPNMQYVSADAGKSDVYGGKKVMVIVPHEDDDINIAGGILEQYTQYGSEVFVVFVTNGDYTGIGKIRIAEAVAACQHMGIHEEHVVFLGYGDQLGEDGLHLYNMKPGKGVVSNAGHTHTYGTESHPAYRSGRAYTSDNLLDDLKSVILQYRPDTILCSDFDAHRDHKAVTLMFEKAMGQILKEHPDYQPIVLKAYAYYPAWVAESDFYAVNILSTVNIFESPYHQKPQIYEWEDRVRLPVAAGTLSRSLVNARAYATLQCYRSQEADKHASSIINGDKVFWQRRTDSLLYRTAVTASSGDAGLLNNFMLIDSNNILDGSLPCDSTWIPATEDREKTINVSFEQHQDIHEIVLYDHPSPEDNVLNAVITFDNGASFETGRLIAGGSASAFAVEQSGIRSFTIALKEFEGNAGLTEIEAYDKPYSAPFSMVKLINQDGHFVYDYVIDRSSCEQFSLYAFPDTLPMLSADTFSVTTDNACCSAQIVNGLLEVLCPSGESCTVTIASRKNPTLFDSVLIRNPTAVQRAVWFFMQKSEQFIHNIYSNDHLQDTVFFRTFNAVASSFPKALHDPIYLLYKLKVLIMEP